MELIRSFNHLREHHQGCVATIGNFDGVHLGHRHVFAALRQKAQSLGLPATAIIFEPQPLEFFQGEKAPARLTRLREKLVALSDLALDRVLCLRFNATLVNMPAEDFIREILVEGLDVKHLIVGDDFRFGYRRQGGFDTLLKAGREAGFEVCDMPTFDVDAERVSSTRIRALLAQGEMQQAAELLGRPYYLCGRVAHGEKRGRLIGFPTANIHLHRHAVPISGVFAVYMHDLEEQAVAGVANMGSRPTVNGSFPLLEVHLFDFSKDIYGHQVRVEFVKRLREERKFASFDALREQINSDAAQARQYLK